MAKSKVRLSITEYDKLIAKFGNLLIEAKKELDRIHSSFDYIIKGDSEGPYWNGRVAITTFKEVKKHVQKDVEAYNALYRVYDALIEKRAELKRKGIYIK